MKRISVFFLILIVISAVSASAQTSLKPDLFGIMKVRYEVSAYDGAQRFSVRNSRLGARGNMSENIRYSLLVEVSSQNNISLVDTYVGYGFGNFEFVLGQQAYHLSAEIDRGAGRNYFTNRSFVSKFLTRYYDDDAVNPRTGDLSSRDLGGMLGYRHTDGLPFEAYLGLFNGSGLNNPVWRDGVNVAAGVKIGPEKGLGGSIGYYGGKSAFGSRMDIWAAGLRYTDERLRVEAEAGQRYLDIDGKKDDLTVGVIYGIYRFPLSGAAGIKSLSPLLRFDVGNNIKFMNESGIIESVDPQRITAGLTIGLSEKELKTELRINYEHYFFKNKPSDYGTNRLFQNKFTLEFFASF